MEDQERKAFIKLLDAMRTYFDARDYRRFCYMVISYREGCKLMDVPTLSDQGMFVMYHEHLEEARKYYPAKECNFDDYS